jgi:DNA-binding NarL/FixJ family response regulator
VSCFCPPGQVRSPAAPKNAVLVFDTAPGAGSNWAMSKQRPSKAAAAPGLPARLPHRDNRVRPWLKRVFHNTYTRQGRRIALRGWSVKLQHGKQRRTFSLEARTRLGAAAEAQGIQADLSAKGWDAVVRQYGDRQGQALPKTDARWWKERLLLRLHPAPAGGGCQQEFSTHIEHAGTGCFFPLGTSDPEAAAVRAVEIYREVIEGGWDIATKSFPREVTVAFHWAFDPLLWTYTTIHTLAAGGHLRPRKASECARNLTCVLLAETDPGIRGALSQCINRHEGYCCVACPTASAARRKCAAKIAALCLVNRDLAGSMGLPNSDQIGTLTEGVPAVSYEVHMDSEELFALTPGGASGYVLKRTAPEHLLEPVLGVLSGGRVAAEALQRSSQSYFQRLLQSGPTGKPTSQTAQLTQREQDVLNLMSKGYVDKEIAPALGISTWTVHEHVKRIFEKLQVHSRTEAVLACLQK